jgi:hypothetical protein
VIGTGVLDRSEEHVWIEQVRIQTNHTMTFLFSRSALSTQSDDSLMSPHDVAELESVSHIDSQLGLGGLIG